MVAQPQLDEPVPIGSVRQKQRSQLSVRLARPRDGLSCTSGSR